MPAQNHTHCYIRQSRPKGSKDPLAYYMCAFPECTSVVHKGMLIGKKSICVHCSGEYILTSGHLQRARPKCDACANKSKAAETVENIINPALNYNQRQNGEGELAGFSELMEDLFK